MDIQGQGSLFLCCLLLGGGMGLVYDGMRLARRILPHGVWAVQIEDGLYWAAVALGVFEVLLQENHGEVRFFLLVAIFGGMGLYGTLASPLVMGVRKGAESHWKTGYVIVDHNFYTLSFALSCLWQTGGEFRQILRWKIQKTLAIM